MNKNHLSDQLGTALNLSIAPIAIAFSDDIPAGVDTYDGAVPAGCSFWEKAAAGTFATSGGDHANCAIGVHTHNLAGAPASQPGELQASVEAMMGLDYVREQEVAAIPVMPKASKHVIYGPLADFPIAIDALLLFADARQGLVLSEAVARVDAGAAPAMGRPACAVVPQVVTSNQAAVSLGCCGARAYLGTLADNLALWALPGAKLEQYAEQIKVLADANNMLSQFHQRRGSDIAAGESPSVAESLQRLAG